MKASARCFAGDKIKIWTVLWRDRRCGERSVIAQGGPRSGQWCMLLLTCRRIPVLPFLRRHRASAGVYTERRAPLRRLRLLLAYVVRFLLQMIFEFGQGQQRRCRFGQCLWNRGTVRLCTRWPWSRGRLTRHPRGAAVLDFSLGYYGGARLLGTLAAFFGGAKDRPHFPCVRALATEVPALCACRLYLRCSRIQVYNTSPTRTRITIFTHASSARFRSGRRRAQSSIRGPCTVVWPLVRPFKLAQSRAPSWDGFHRALVVARLGFVSMRGLV